MNGVQAEAEVVEEVPMSRTLRAVESMVERSDEVIRLLHEAAFDAGGDKVLTRRYSITAVTEMVGRTAETIRKAEKAGHLPEPDLSEQGRRVGYSLEAVNRIRAHFGVQPGRATDDRPVRLSFQNFKGGVGKSTLCCHCAQNLAQKGYRVLLVDCDSQASTTTTFGIRPDAELDAEETLLPFLSGEREGLDYAVRTTHWDQLHLIPANLDLYSAEYYLAGIAGDTDFDWISLLDQGIRTVEDNYDVILIDPPPALGLISLNVVRALTGLIVPTPPAMYDYHSTTTFFRMLGEVLGSVGRSIGEPFELDFIKLLVSKYDTSKPAQEFVAQLVAEHYAAHVLRTPLLQSAEIDNASGEWMTVYELPKATSSNKTYRRCLNSLNAVFDEVELLIRQCWPSHRSKLAAEGHSLL